MLNTATMCSSVDPECWAAGHEGRDRLITEVHKTLIYKFEEAEISIDSHRRPYSQYIEEYEQHVAEVWLGQQGSLHGYSNALVPVWQEKWTGEPVGSLISITHHDESHEWRGILS